ncbi:MAG: type II toxin-antitoxin system HicA family toxin [bacterium]|nr:type II toxin-antitoxin system HicA family toxin [bacterium]MDE0351694.1 type II toxin-antitoxin system HicA family toxin [bacterium]
MSRRLTPVSHRDLLRKLRSFGWEGPIRGSKHSHMVQPGREYPVTIPNPHSGQEVSVPLLRQILRQAGISRDEWLDG